MALRPGSQTVFEIHNFRPNPPDLYPRTRNRTFRSFLLDIDGIFGFLATVDAFSDPPIIGLPQGAFLYVLVTPFPAIPDTVFPTIMDVDCVQNAYFVNFGSERRGFRVRNCREIEIRDRNLVNETRFSACVKNLNHLGPPTA